MIDLQELADALQHVGLQGEFSPEGMRSLNVVSLDGNSARIGEDEGAVDKSSPFYYKDQIRYVLRKRWRDGNPYNSLQSWFPDDEPECPELCFAMLDVLERNKVWASFHPTTKDGARYFCEVLGDAYDATYGNTRTEAVAAYLIQAHKAGLLVSDAKGGEGVG